MANRKLTLEEEVLAVIPEYGTFDIPAIKSKIGGKVALEGGELDIYCSFIERAIMDHIANGYLWIIKHPLRGELFGYMISTKGLKLKENILEELKTGALYFGPIRQTK